MRSTVMTRFTASHWAVASTGTVAVAHILAWPYTAAVLAATALYRLLAERVRRKTLVELVTRAPGGTIVVMESGPGGPAIWVRVGETTRLPSMPAAEVRRAHR
jgi:hypothetical protein